MKFPFFIAKRYLFTSKSKNVVNIISYISLFGVAIGTAALVVGLSVFNGLEDLVLSKYNSFDPHLKVTSSVGKTFKISELDSTLKENNDIENYSFILEEKVLIEYEGKKIISEIKGVDDNYYKLVDIDSIIKAGEYFSDELYRTKDVMVVGAGIANSLSVHINNMITVTSPKRDSRYIKDASDLVSEPFTVLGVFSVQAEYDNQYVLIPLNRAQKMLEREGEASSAEINIKDSDKMNQIKIELEQILGEDFVVKSRLEQHEFLYKIFNTEKLAVFLILVFILIIASFNIISSLSMLMIDKQNDIKTFWNLGSSEKQIRNIFFIKGFFGVLLGSFIGIGIGVSFSLLQQHFGFISMPENFIVSAYPIKLLFSSILIVELTVVIIGLIASYYPAKILTSKFLNKVPIVVIDKSINEIKVYRTWQKVCFVIFGGGIVFELIVGEGLDFSSAYMVGKTSGNIILWSLILIIVLMFGKKNK